MDIIHAIEIIWIAGIQNVFGVLTPFFKAVTFLGSEDFFILIMPILYWCVDAGQGFRLGLILMLSGHLNGVFKVIFHSPRPFWVDPKVSALTVENSFGLPSGHAMNTLSIWGLAAYMFHKRSFTILSVVVILLVGFSRLALGVHFFSDVVTGWLIGLILLLLFIKYDCKVTRWLTSMDLTKHIWLVIITTLILIAIGCLPYLVPGRVALPSIWEQNAILSGVEVMPLPYDLSGIFTTAGTWLGMGLGVAIIFHQGGLPKAGTPGKVILRYIIGLAGLMVLWYGLGAVFPRGEQVIPLLLRLLRYTLVGFWIGAGAPWIFQKFKLISTIQVD